MPHLPRFIQILLALPPLLILCGSILAAVIDEARSALINRNYSKAAELAATESSPAALIVRANALRALGRHAEAITAYDTLATRFPAAEEQNKALFGKASSLMALKRFEEAGSILRAALARLSVPARVRAQAMIYVSMADRLVEPADKNQAPEYSKALALYTAALDAGTLPSDLDYRILVSRAKCRIALRGRYQLNQAQSELEDLIKKNPTLPQHQLTELRYHLGRIYRGLGRADAAEHYLTIASRGTNAGIIPLLSAGELLDVLGFPAVNRRELARGRQIVREITSRFSTNTESGSLLFRTAMAEVKAGEYEAGLKSFEACIARWPDGENAAEAFFRSSETLFTLNKHADAMQSLRTLLSRYPGSGFWQQAQRLLVDVEFGEADRAMTGEEYTKASELWTRFMSRYPLDRRTPKAALRLGQSLEQRKQWKAAVDCWQDVNKRWPASEEGQEACILAAAVLADKLDNHEAAIELLKKPTIWKIKQRAAQKIRELENESLTLSTPGIFPQGAQASVSLDARNLSKVRVRIYHLESEAYFRSQAGFSGMEKLDIDLISPDKDFWFPIPDYKKYRLSHVQIPIEVLGPGTWVIQCSSDKLQSSTLLVKSDLGLVVRAARGQVIVQTTDLGTGRAVAEAEILLSNGKDVYASGKTGSDGIFVSSATNEQAAATIAVFARSGKNVAAVSPGWFDQFSPTKTKLVSHLAADRQAWRPGDAVHFRLTLRLRDAIGLLTIPREDYLVTARTPTGIEVFKKNLSPDALGTISGEFTIDPAEAQGSITLSLLNKDRSQSAVHYLRVEEYSAKETSIEFTQVPLVPLVGDQISVTATCAHLWGEPAAGRHILWRINQEEWNTALTDPSGQIRISIDSAQRISGQALMVSVRPSWENTITTHRIDFASKDISLSLLPLREIWLDTENPNLQITLEPIPGAIKRRSVVLTANLLTNGRSMLITSKTVRLEGKSSVELPRLRPGEYSITASTPSSSGEEVSAQAKITVSGPNDKNRVHILQDSREIKTGQALKIRIHSRLEKAQDGLLVFERERIISQQRIRIPAGESSVTVFPEESLSPSFRLSLMTATSNGFYTAHADYTLKHALDLNITASPTPMPGKELSLRIAAKTPAGEKAASSLFVFVIDDAIWSAVQGKREDIVRTFFPKLPLVTSRAASFTPFVYSAITAERDPDMVTLEKDRDAGMADQPSLRATPSMGRTSKSERGADKFDQVVEERKEKPLTQSAWAELAWYASSLKTDRDGIAQAKFILPDRPASWRIVTVAVSGASLFGDTETLVHAVQTTHAKIQAPDSITSEDSVQIPLIISTRAKNTLTGTLRWQLETTNGNTLASGSLPWSVTSAAASEVFIPLAKPKPGSFVLRVSDPAFNAAVPILVQPAGERRVSGTSVLVRSSWEKQFVHAPKATSRRLLIRAQAPESILLDTIPDFIGRNQLSGIIATIVRDTAALEYLTAIRPSEALRQNTLSSSITSRVQHLAVLQKTGWNETLPADYETAWLGFALQRCQAAGITIESSLLEWNKKRLEQLFSASDNTEFKALALFALAGKSDSPFAWMNRLYRERDRLAPRELALLALALETSGRRAMSTELVRILTKAFVRKDGQAHIPGKEVRHIHWMSGTNGTTALAALALSAVASDATSRTIIGEALAWLDAERSGFGWQTPAENGIIPLVHARYLISQAVSANWSARISVNGRAVGTILSSNPSSIVLEDMDLATDGSRIRVQLDGAGPARILCQLVETLPPEASPQKDFPGTFELSLQHPAYTLEGKAVPRGMSILADWAANPTNELAKVSRGSPFTAEIRLRSGSTRPDEIVVIEFAIPSGCRPTGLTKNPAVLYRERLAGRIRYLVKAPPPLETLHIREGLIAFAPGESWLASSVCYPISTPWKRSGTQRKRFSILAPGSEIFADYRFSADEMHRIGEWHFQRGELDQAKALLGECLSRWQLKSKPAREIGLMLLEIAVRQKNARETVRHFESLKEKHQDLSISLEQADAVALAYTRMGEHERSCQVLEGIIEAKFLQDSSVSAAWLAAGEVRNAASSLRKVWLEYPDGPEEIASVSSFAQQLFQMASELSTEELAKRGVTKDWLKDEALALFDAVLAAAPASPLAPEIAFSAVSLLFEREHWQAAEKRARMAIGVYTNTHFSDSFRYLLASTLYFEGKFAEASSECSSVAEKHFLQQDGSQGPSRYRDYALHMLGKIRHSEQKHAEAIRLYQGVKNRFSDAARAIEHLKQKTLSLPEITTVSLNQDATLEITSRNITSASLTLYKVDFLMLCLKQKDLRNVKGINLAGIRPSLTTTISLGKSGHPMSETSRVAIPVKETGAWLVVIKADGIEQSGMIIRSDLVLDVMTTSDGSVRASLHDKKTGLPLVGAQLRFIPSDGQRSTTATSDPRGMAESQATRGNMIIAAVHAGQYAFQRIENRASPRSRADDEYGNDYKEKSMESLKQYRKTIQDSNRTRWEQNQTLEKRQLELKNLKF